MRRMIAIFKNSLHTINAIVAILIVAIYFITHFNLSGYLAKNVITEDLAKYLDTEVSLENAEVDIFNQFVLDNFLVKDQAQDTLLFARRVMVSFDILPLLQKELQIHTVQLIDFDLHLSKQDSLSEPNFQFLIDRFVPKTSNKKGKKKKVLEDIAVNSLILRSGSLTYDDYSKVEKKEHIDINHLDLYNISSNLKIQSSKKDGLYARLKRLTFQEKSGLNITHATSVVQLDAEGKRLDFNDINIQCQQTLNQNLVADVSLVGFASMENKEVNADIVLMKVKIPGELDLETNAKFADLLSFSDTMRFDIGVEKCNLSADILETIANRFAPKTLDYIARIQEASVIGKAEGTPQNFTYSAALECFGEMSASALLDGKFIDSEPIDCQLSAEVANLEWNKYTYDALTIAGQLKQESFNGTIEIEDPNCSVSAIGQYSFGKKKQHINTKAEVRHIEPYKLNLTEFKNLEDVALSASITADIDIPKHNLPNGELFVDSILLRRDSDEYRIPRIEILASDEREGYAASLYSKIANVQYYRVSDHEKIQSQLYDSRDLSEILQLPISITGNGSVNIQLDSLRHISQSEIILPNVLYDGAALDLFLKSREEDDSLRHTLKIDYKKADTHLASTMLGTTRFSPLFVDIQPCKVLFNNDQINCGRFTIAQNSSKEYNLKHFAMKIKDQSVNAHGIIANDGRSDLVIHVENVGIDTLCSLSDYTYLQFGGIASGDIYYKSDSLRLITTDNLFVKDFHYLGGLLGDTKLNARYNIDQKRVDLIADISSKEDSVSKISGYVQIAKKDSLDLQIHGNKLNLDFLNFWVSGFLEELEGNISGDAHLYGLAKELKLEGRPYADVSFTNHISGSRFYYRDTITLTKDSYSEDGFILMNDGKLYDRFNHLAHVNANIKHRYLRKYNYTVQVDLPDNNSGFLLFDKPTHYNNEIYWGQLFSSGTALLSGGDSKHRIEISCKTVGRSQLNLSPNEESYSDNNYNFLTFRDKSIEAERNINEEKANSIISNNEQEGKDDGTIIEFDLLAQATENCQVFVQMDPLAEDRLMCRGTGDISLHYDTKHDMTLGGVYNISSGSYLVTMRGDLINKEFKIQNGSRVMFPGSFRAAELDLNAVYSIPSVNLRDLDESFATMASMNRTTLPVDCKLAVNGQLSAPQIAFDLEVKNTSDDVQALVHNLIGTQEMLNREVFYLLLFSKFYTPEYASTTQNNSGSELSSFTSASLTSQLNNLLGHMSDYFTLGTNFHTDRGDFSDMEMDLSLSTRLFSDRLILNGNLGYRDPANRVGMNNDANSFIGDFDVEYLINTSGTLRMKAYSHYNERDYSINNALTTQGIGFIVRKDFNSLNDLLKLSKKTKK